MEIKPGSGPGPGPSPSPQAIAARKLWNIVRIVFLMLRKGIAKSKAAVDLNLLLKRGKLAAAKAIAGAAVTLHGDRNNAVVQPRRDYEFSCSNSPALFPFKRKHQRSTRCHDDVLKMLEMLNNDNKVVEASPLPWFGKSTHLGRKLRVTDSPFPVKDEERDDHDDDGEVDLAAEEFIKRFYRDLNLQRKMAAIESPYHYSSWDR
ncbi:uncharacterized protein LOC109790281 [Cajanus cajan]|uniref:Avr9/Cf-9 rapidly elicited protein 146 n=1 Tax=Cajanus cajan TaxID=3821 RepID=A0A151R3X6_CAJCA|nr:uncharacterized protein LOC109790281 [Cajanus cajan]KYP37192.1 hypothetical protein KK1_041625 [Cajanus cajan]